jgi:hypothetical protein
MTPSVLLCSPVIILLVNNINPFCPALSLVPLRQFQAKKGMPEPRQAGNTPSEA